MRKEKISWYEKKTMKVSFISIVVNLLLAGLKFLAGIFGHSQAMMSDAMHSLSDVLSTGIVMVGVHFSTKEADAKHPYGHERFECVAAVILAVMLMVTGMIIGMDGVKRMMAGNLYDIPSGYTLMVAILSIVIKEIMYWYCRYYALSIRSDALMADAWHHRSDALSSVGSFIGILGTRLGFVYMDLLASVMISLMILIASVQIFKEAFTKMVDHAGDDVFIEALSEMILEQNGVLMIEELKTRLFGNKIYVDVAIIVDKNETLGSAHTIAHQLHDQIEKQYGQVKHCHVHVSPSQ